MPIEDPDVTNVPMFCNCTKVQPVRMLCVEHSQMFNQATYQCTACGRRKQVRYSSMFRKIDISDL